jgi:penicillin-insensitive murein endopeptidase
VPLQKTLAILATLTVFVGCGGTSAEVPTTRVKTPRRELAPERVYPTATPREVSAGPLSVPEVTVVPAPLPFAGVTTAALELGLLKAPTQLPTASIGAPNRGALFNGVQLSEDPRWIIPDPARAWGTPITVEQVKRAIATVHERHPNTPPLYVGDLGRQRGGWLRPHRSHQSGRDVDLGYYYRDGSAWYVPATDKNLDVERTWTLTEAVLAGGYVDQIFMDGSVQALLRAHALERGLAAEDADALFGGYARRSEAVIRHTWGHRTHLHVRFFDPAAEEAGQRLYPVLVKLRRMR